MKVYWNNSIQRTKHKVHIEEWYDVHVVSYPGRTTLCPIRTYKRLLNVGKMKRTVKNILLVHFNLQLSESLHQPMFHLDSGVGVGACHQSKVIFLL